MRFRIPLEMGPLAYCSECAGCRVENLVHVIQFCPLCRLRITKSSDWSEECGLGKNAVTAVWLPISLTKQRSHFQNKRERY